MFITGVKRKSGKTGAALAAALAVGLAGCLYDDSEGGSTLNPKTAFVSGGTFMMGCTAEQDGECAENEKPAREVTVGSFYIAKTPVTQAEWSKLMGDEIIKWCVSSVGDKYPMYGVTWNEANQYIRKLSERTGKNYRLPTEAEWEYAARGGGNSGGYKYSGSDDIDKAAWYSGNSGSRVREVCKKPANELGLCDMSGNVREWVNDEIGGGDRVFRGGSWATEARMCRVSARDGAAPGNRNNYIGFRVAMSP
jgi:formylglycine-generating enzyme required for sulfatase activity